MKHNFIILSYKLYTISDGKKGLVEQTTADRPFDFISGFGIALDEFERQVEGLEPGTAFDFTLTADQAYGTYDDERVVSLDREVFTLDGRFDHENIYEGAVVPLQNEQGDRFMGIVSEITDTSVVVDLNHPLAGKSLQFVGEIIENREATDEEIVSMINRGGCGCSCGDCEGNEKGEGCGCGKCH